MSEAVQPGKYTHYKGGHYTVVMMVEHHETREPMVVYVCNKRGTVNVRPLRGHKGDPDGWEDLVTVQSTEGEPMQVPRFMGPVAPQD